MQNENEIKVEVTNKVKRTYCTKLRAAPLSFKIRVVRPEWLSLITIVVCGPIPWLCSIIQSAKISNKG